MPSVAVIVFASSVVLLAYVIFGISGFGSTIIAVPLLAHFYPIKFLIPMIVLLDCIGAITMGVRLRADINKAELKPLLPFLAAGLLVGAFLLLRVPADLLLGGLGAVVIVYGALYASGRQPAFRVPRWTAAPVGLFAGMTSSMFGVGGPIYVMYLTARGSAPQNIRATVPVIFIFTTVARIAIFAVAGLFTLQVLYTAAALLPLMILGIWLGHHLHLNMTREQMVRIIGVLLVASGGSLVVRALAS
ncbi:MAG TPA: sulfite exporter TauE/SafE family protein [Burkholderiales bacterium]|nr:sulfite exporter TauE/SafE family protein [Burkholderiales bacterium]